MLTTIEMSNKNFTKVQSLVWGIKIKPFSCKMTEEGSALALIYSVSFLLSVHNKCISKNF